MFPVNTESCPAGQSYSHHSQSCEQCAVGSFQSKSGQFRCQKCPPLKTTPTSGATSAGHCTGRRKCSSYRHKCRVVVIFLFVSVVHIVFCEILSIRGYGSFGSNSIQGRFKKWEKWKFVRLKLYVTLHISACLSGGFQYRFGLVDYRSKSCGNMLTVLRLFHKLYTYPSMW